MPKRGFATWQQRIAAKARRTAGSPVVGTRALGRIDQAGRPGAVAVSTAATGDRARPAAVLVVPVPLGVTDQQAAADVTQRARVAALVRVAIELTATAAGTVRARALPGVRTPVATAAREAGVPTAEGVMSVMDAGAAVPRHALVRDLALEDATRLQGAKAETGAKAVADADPMLGRRGVPGPASVPPATGIGATAGGRAHPVPAVGSGGPRMGVQPDVVTAIDARRMTAISAVVVTCDRRATAVRRANIVREMHESADRHRALVTERAEVTGLGTRPVRVEMASIGPMVRGTAVAAATVRTNAVGPAEVSATTGGTIATGRERAVAGRRELPHRAVGMTAVLAGSTIVVRTRNVEGWLLGASDPGTTTRRSPNRWNRGISIVRRAWS
ncbi:hypothetical protein HII28_00010 [Planctomonas sp. JC2975]|uniref:hypothetical protein n=1 Tax=Planctomonas sp. JC2975 TaxID=2729626 RepID=UPI0014751579|nr:hypothetical protein [Planctomonas sp. JC2975]NNC10272.1 hypothetical protein [Planctomonas sp. JC2975]